jgi:hypothetical protein
MIDYRIKMFNPRTVLCTGNPDKPYTIASAVKEMYPAATFIHKSNGYDLTNLDEGATMKLIELFKNHNTFINASYIGPKIQSNLLTLCKESVKICDVFNIGSTHEYDNLGSVSYSSSKLDLRNKSLEYNSYRFKTCHIVVGGIKKSGEPDKANWIDINEICSIIDWVTKQRFNVPIISLDQPKQPW